MVRGDRHVNKPSLGKSSFRDYMHLWHSPLWCAYLWCSAYKREGNVSDQRTNLKVIQAQLCTIRRRAKVTRTCQQELSVDITAWFAFTYKRFHLEVLYLQPHRVTREGSGCSSSEYTLPHSWGHRKSHRGGIHWGHLWLHGTLSRLPRQECEFDSTFLVDKHSWVRMCVGCAFLFISISGDV